jgi:hypothetical protein
MAEGTHFSSLIAKRQSGTGATIPALQDSRAGDFYYDTTNNRMAVFNGTNWVYAQFTTTTSSSTSRTTTSTSITTTSSSTSTTRTTSTSISTSTTTTL